VGETAAGPSPGLAEALAAALPEVPPSASSSAALAAIAVLPNDPESLSMA